jgi:hypothetical protein
LTASLQVAVWQVTEQTKLVQSVEATQVLPEPQAVHTEPPQSVSVSLPFFAKSVQLALWQKPPEQTPPRQSLLAAQCLPAPHFGHTAPPQSTSVSEPFFTTSVQLAAWHVVLQTPL